LYRCLESAERLQQAILITRFNQALAAGTLDLDRFHFYLAQDARYLAVLRRCWLPRRPGDNADEAAFFAAARRSL